MKYLLVKGWLGFGDRLECLKMCVKYALQYKRAILVDWSDSIFSHSDESFYTYFSLKMPTFKLPLDSSLSVYPSYWKDKLDMKIDDTILIPEINLGFLDKEFSEDIIVYCS